MSIVIKKTSKGDQAIASSSIVKFTQLNEEMMKAKLKKIPIRIGESNEVMIPLSALKLLTKILDNMAKGMSNTLVETEAEVSTQKVAELLNVSRPHVVKLLENGVIPYKKVGSHRRVLLEDAIEYQVKTKIQRRNLLDEISKEAQNLNLGY